MLHSSEIQKFSRTEPGLRATPIVWQTHLVYLVFGKTRDFSSPTVWQTGWQKLATWQTWLFHAHICALHTTWHRFFPPAPALSRARPEISRTLPARAPLRVVDQIERVERVAAAFIFAHDVPSVAHTATSPSCARRLLLRKAEVRSEYSRPTLQLAR